MPRANRGFLHSAVAEAEADKPPQRMADDFGWEAMVLVAVGKDWCIHPLRISHSTAAQHVDDTLASPPPVSIRRISYLGCLRRRGLLAGDTAEGPQTRHTAQDRGLFLGEQHGAAVQARACAHVERPGKWLLRFFPCFLAEVEIIIRRFFKHTRQGFHVCSLVANEAADIFDLAIEHPIVVAVVNRADIALRAQHIRHSRPSGSSVAMIWSIR